MTLQDQLLDGIDRISHHVRHALVSGGSDETFVSDVVAAVIQRDPRLLFSPLQEQIESVMRELPDDLLRSDLGASPRFLVRTVAENHHDKIEDVKVIAKENRPLSILTIIEPWANRDHGSLNMSRHAIAERARRKELTAKSVVRSQEVETIRARLGMQKPEIKKSTPRRCMMQTGASV